MKEPLDCVFVNPPRPDLTNPLAQMPLGILYLAAVCEQSGLRVDVTNLANCDLAGIADGLKMLPEARVYGITGTFLDVPTVNLLAEILRITRPDSRILVGGPICLSVEQLNLEVIDDVVAGEAENAIAALVTGDGGGTCGEDVRLRNHASQQKGEGEDKDRRQGFSAPLDLDGLPFPARHLWRGPFGGDVFIGGRNYFGGGSATVLTSRGCPMRCAFCAGPALVSRKIRTRSPANVIAELERLVMDYGVRQFRFSDEFFTAKRSHAEDVCRAIMASKLLGYGDGLAWRCSIGVNPHEVDLFKLMRAAGCREVSLGIESADPRVIDMICPAKGNPEQGILALKAAREAGMLSRALMMVGTPGTRLETLEHNLTFIRTAPYDALAVTVFSPIPGSMIEREPEKYRCRILEANRSICLYGKEGMNPIEPTIAVEGMTTMQLAEQMKATIDAARRTGKLGSG